MAELVSVALFLALRRAAVSRYAAPVPSQLLLLTEDLLRQVLRSTLLFRVECEVGFGARTFLSAIRIKSRASARDAKSFTYLK